MTYKYNQSSNQKLTYNYHPINQYSADKDIYGSVSPVLHLLENKKDLVIAEIGVFEGDSSLSLLEYCDIKKIYLIDPFSKEIADSINFKDGINNKLDINLFNRTKQRLDKFKDKIIWLQEISDTAHTKIPDDELDFIFIDGAHTYEAVYKDLVNFYSKVKMNGIIAGDDFSNKFESFGIIEAVNDVLPQVGYTEIDLYRHPHKPEDYYSSFAFTKTINTTVV